MTPRTVLVVLAMLAIVGCSMQRQRNDRAGSPVLHVGAPVGIAGFDPSEGTTFPSTAFNALIFEGLTAVDDSDHIVGNLARSWTVSADGRMYRFRLRSDAWFHDGSPMHATNVIEAWERALRASTPVNQPYMLLPIEGAADFVTGRAAHVSGLHAEDDSTLVVQLHQPLAPFIAMLAMPQAAVAARTSTREHPIGTGPWRWVSGRPSDPEIRLARHARSPEPPQLDSLIWHVLPDTAVAPAMLDGTIDYAIDMPEQDLASIASNPGFGLLETPTTNVVELLINHRVPALRDVRVRDAICRAIDVTSVQQALGTERDVPAAGPIPPGTIGYDPGLRRCPFDPDSARALLRASGYPAGRVLTIGVGQHGQLGIAPEVGRQLMRFLEGVGVTVAVHRHVDTFVVPVDSLDDLMLGMWRPDYPDGDTYLYPLFHSATAGLTSNRGAWADPVTDRLLDASRAAASPAEHEQRLQRAAAWVAGQHATIPLWYARTATAFSLRLTGWSAGAYPSRFTHVRLAAPPR